MTLTETEYYIYILECSNGHYYTGYTTDIKRRYQEHLNGSIKCKYTRSFPPRKLAACWHFQNADLSAILKTEKAIKSLSKKNKENLISKPSLLSDIVAENLAYIILKAPARKSCQTSGNPSLR